MKITNIQLEEGLPTEITATIPVAEAALIARLVGRINDIDANDLMRFGAHVRDKVYDCLTDSLFNRFYDDGVDDYIRG